jgi:hypothetical protein
VQQGQRRGSILLVGALQRRRQQCRCEKSFRSTADLLNRINCVSKTVLMRFARGHRSSLKVWRVKHEVHFEGVSGPTSIRPRNQFDCHGYWMLHHEAGLRRSVDRNCRRVCCRLFPSQLRQRAGGELLFAARSDKKGGSEIGRHGLVLGKECSGSRRSVRYPGLYRLGGAEGAWLPPVEVGEASSAHC